MTFVFEVSVKSRFTVADKQFQMTCRAHENTDREFVTSAKKIREFYEIKKICKNSLKIRQMPEWAWPSSGIVYLFK